MTGKSDRILRDDLFIIKRYTGGAHTVAVGSQYSWTNGSMGYSNPDGYVPVGVSYINTGNAQLGLSYFTTDITGTYGFASRNGSQSSATNATPIIDVVYAPEDMVEFNSDTSMKMFKKLTFSYSYSLSNTATAKITPTQLGFYVPEGYQIFSVTAAVSGTAKVYIITFNPFNTSHILQLRNASGETVSTSASIRVTFIRKDFAEQVLA